VHAASLGNLTLEPGAPSGGRIFGAESGFDPFEFPNGTIYDRLAERGLRYAIYAASNCPQVGAISPSTDDLDLNIVDFDSLAGDLQHSNFPSYVFIEPDNGPIRPRIAIVKRRTTCIRHQMSGMARRL
jgi:hypothetical protein